MIRADWLLRHILLILLQAEYIGVENQISIIFIRPRTGNLERNEIIRSCAALLNSQSI